MTNEDIAVELKGYEHEIKSLKHRMASQEEQSKAVQDLVISVKELALNMKNMYEEQKDQGARLEELERKPAEQWSAVKRTIFTSIVSTIAGAAAATICGLLF